MKMPRMPALRRPEYRRPRLGLALGGGGARGFAHIGVLKVLQAQAIAVDFLAGTSMGGIVAAALSVGMTIAEMESEALALRTRELVDIRLPRDGLLEGRRVRERLLRIFGERTFADTRIPLCLTSVDLDTGQELCLREGLIVDALRATISVPGIFRPAEWQGKHLVDGGVLNNVPTSVARDMGAEVVVAVDVTTSSFQPMAEETAAGAGSLVSFAKLNPLFITLSRSLQIMEADIVAHRLEQAPPDVLICPEIGRLGMEEFQRAAQIIPAGEQAAAQALPRIQELLRKRIVWG